ncbi:MAG TPA: hypothetical protein VLN56_10810 [Gammaproteobacteria bacterium]|nr:hypothetical protein [Gammaproteobacteria bacterium]
MTLTRKEIDGLMRLIGLTKDDEINCDQCLALIAEFAEQELSGKSIPEGLNAVEHHLSLCSECCEEYQVLKQALKEMDC